MKNVKLVVIAVFVLFATFFNVISGLKSNHKFYLLKKLDSVEAMATGEIGSPMQKTSHYMCSVMKKVIVAQDGYGNPIFQDISVPGMIGICDGPSGPCQSYKCTETL